MDLEVTLITESQRRLERVCAAITSVDAISERRRISFACFTGSSLCTAKDTNCEKRPGIDMRVLTIDNSDT